MRTRISAAAAGAALLALGAVAGCAAGGSTDGGSEPAGETLTVLAAASLTETFTALAEEFEASHPGVEVTLAFDSSATLAQQALEGAPADLLATADTRTIESAADALAAAPEVFATNTLVLVVPAGNPAGIRSVTDLAEPGTTFVACVETAPCGATWAALAADTGVTADPASLEVDVKAVLARVVADEVDAGVVYATDAAAAGDAVQSLELPGAEQHVTSYPLALLEQSTRPDLAQQLADLVLGETGRRVLGDAGFGAP